MSDQNERSPLLNRRWKSSAILIAVTLATSVALGAWKVNELGESAEAAANQQEPANAVASAIATKRDHSRTTTSIGTVVALRSITVRNEIAGTVKRAHLTPGEIVEPGAVIIALDTSVEQAELQALEAQAQLAETQLARMQRMVEKKAASEMELDTARAQRDVAHAQIARTRAVIAKKTIRAPFRARIGISDVHEGQYLNEGTQLTTLQGVGDAVYIDFTVAQQVAAALTKDARVQVVVANGIDPIDAKIVALDSRIDPSTRNTVVRARVPDARRAPQPGASVRVEVPTGAPRSVVLVPASALRKGPGGDHVFVLEADEKSGTVRARQRTVTVDGLEGDDVVVTSGLEAGERVAASGAFKLHENALVAITDAPATPPTAANVR
jgi:membrane fusion protein (multidrug efflux system)